MAKRGNDKSNRPIVIRREEASGDGGHHGGAWKIAYADFVTAMMAFFLLMWLINATTDAQRVGLADYFAPTNVLARADSGSGEPFGGRTINSDRKLAGESVPQVNSAAVTRPHPPADEDDMEGNEAAATAPQRAVAYRLRAMLEASTTPPNATNATNASPLPQPTSAAQDNPGGDATPPAPPDEREPLNRAAQEIRAAIDNDPQLAELARQLVVEQVPEGLRIQVVDADGQPVFATGQAAPNARGRAVLLRAAAVVARLPNPIDITGHTDASPFRGSTDRSNWELSSERASATRRLLIEAGIAESRIRAVAGRAERDLLLPEQPLDAANRRVSILVALPAHTTPSPQAGAAP